MTVLHTFPNGLKLLWPPYSDEERAELKERQKKAALPPIRMTRVEPEATALRKKVDPAD